jgi:hypothetical protein
MRRAKSYTHHYSHSPLVKSLSLNHPYPRIMPAISNWPKIYLSGWVDLAQHSGLRYHAPKAWRTPVHNGWSVKYKVSRSEIQSSTANCRISKSHCTISAIHTIFEGYSWLAERQVQPMQGPAVCSVGCSVNIELYAHSCRIHQSSARAAHK